MKKFFVGLLLVAAAFSMTGCGTERIDAGHVGIKVNMYGDNKGVDDVTAVTGRVWYNPMTTQVFEVPTYMQNAVWTADKREGSRTNQEITFQTNEGLEIKANIALNYSLDSVLVPQLFTKFRKDPIELQDTYLRTQVRNIFVTAASGYSIEDFIQNKGEFLKLVQAAAVEKLTPEGFVIDTLTFVGSPTYPPSVVRAIKNKINATQIAQQKERELEQAVADAAKAKADAAGVANAAIESARGKAESTLLNAKAEANANLLKARAEAKGIKLVRANLSREYIEYLKVLGWDGAYPSVMAGSGTELLIDSRK